MLSQEELERTLALALGEFAPAWKIVGECGPVDPFDASHWDAGSQSVQCTLRHRVTGHLKVLGRRVAYEPDASLHPAVALSLIEAYRHGNAEPIRRYWEEIGVAVTSVGDASPFSRRPSLPPPASGSAATQVDAPPTAVAARPGTVDSRGRVLRRLKRELQIWQWRRSTPAADLGSTRVRKD